jgi:hypothetical protein
MPGVVGRNLEIRSGIDLHIALRIELQPILAARIDLRTGLTGKHGKAAIVVAGLEWAGGLGGIVRVVKCGAVVDAEDIELAGQSAFPDAGGSRAG